MAHVELARKLAKRDPATAPVVGDRVPYVMVQKGPRAKGYEKAEDPLYVLQNNLPIDTQYYLTNQLTKPLTRIFEPITGNADAVLKGDHTRKVYKATSKKSAGGLMGLLRKKNHVLVVVHQLQIMLVHYVNIVYHRKVLYLWKNKRKFNNMKLNIVNYECQRCQGTLHTDILCSNSDCPIFYMRIKAQNDLEDATKVLQEFKW